MTDLNEPESKDELIAEYLTDEMTPDRQAAFDRMLHDDPALAADMRDMSRTVRLMTGLGDSSVRAEPSSPKPFGAAQFVHHALKYAAIIGLSFVAGIAVRSNVHTSSVDPAQPSTIDLQLSGSSRAGNDGRHPWEHRAADMYVKAHSGSSLGRSLIALAHAADTTSR